MNCAPSPATWAPPRSEIYLGARATEREVKRLSASGELAQIPHRAFRHSRRRLRARCRATAEPGLLLTPPATPSEEDDGYLTASEIAGSEARRGLGDPVGMQHRGGRRAKTPEPLSGLARAFFYAQARALLVSHWEVNSEATVKLVTGAMRRLAADKTMGRAEAMRQSMLALIEKGGLTRHNQPIGHRSW